MRTRIYIHDWTEEAMDTTIVANMFSLVETLSQKTRFTGPELTCYLKGLSFVENYFELNNRIFQKRVQELSDDDYTRDTKETLGEGTPI